MTLSHCACLSCLFAVAFASKQQLVEAQGELQAAKSTLQARANEILTLKNQLKDCQLSLSTCVVIRGDVT